MAVELSGHYGYRRIVKTMTPMVLMMIVISVYSLVDGYFISNWAGSDAFAGMNLIWPPIAIIGALGMMVGAGGSALVSKTFGEGDAAKANRIFSMLIRVMIIAGVILAALVFLAMPWIARILGANEAMMPHAVLYGRILIAVLPAYMLQMGFQPFFMVAERPHMGTAISLVCGITNIVLDALFVAAFGWGLTGAALASSASLLVGGCYPLWYFASKRNKTQLRFVRCGNDWKSIGKSCSNGLSEFVGNIALNVIGICYNLQLMKYIGADGVSAYGIVMYVGFLFGAVFIGYNMGISQIISYNYGAGNKAELRSLLKKSLILMGLAGVFLTALAQLTAPWVAKVFVGYSEELCRLSQHALRIYMYSFILCGINMFASAWFTALNNGVVSAVMAFVRSFVFELACIFILPAILGIEGIWLAVDVAECLSVLLAIGLIVGMGKRYGYLGS